MFPLEEENVNAPVPPLLGYITALFIVPVIFGNCPFVVVPMYDPAVPATTLPSVNVGKLNVGLLYPPRTHTGHIYPPAAHIYAHTRTQTH